MEAKNLVIRRKRKNRKVSRGDNKIQRKGWTSGADADCKASLGMSALKQFRAAFKHSAFYLGVSALTKQSQAAIKHLVAILECHKQSQAPNGDMEEEVKLAVPGARWRQ